MVFIALHYYLFLPSVHDFVSNLIHRKARCVKKLPKNLKKITAQVSRFMECYGKKVLMVKNVNEEGEIIIYRIVVSNFFFFRTVAFETQMLSCEWPRRKDG